MSPRQHNTKQTETADTARNAQNKKHYEDASKKKAIAQVYNYFGEFLYINKCYFKC